MLDFASGQGELAQACVAERVPYHGFTLSECQNPTSSETLPAEACPLFGKVGNASDQLCCDADAN